MPLSANNCKTEAYLFEALLNIDGGDGMPTLLRKIGARMGYNF